jgi:Peptidase inhibitor family I36
VSRSAEIIRAQLLAFLLCSLGITAVVFLAVQLTSTSAASAASAAYTDCASQDFCLWHDGSYSGQRWDFNIAANGYGHWNYVGDAAYHQASSLYNNRQHVTWIGDVELVGSNLPLDVDCIGSGAMRAHLSQYGYPPNYTTGENDNIGYYDLQYSQTVC